MIGLAITLTAAARRSACNAACVLALIESRLVARRDALLERERAEDADCARDVVLYDDRCFQCSSTGSLYCDKCAVLDAGRLA